MPAGKIEEYSDEDYVPVDCSDTSSSDEEPKKEEKQLPEINDFGDLLMEIKQRGGLSLENCQEITQIRWAIFEAHKNEEIRNASLQMFNMTLNLANMFLIHYNRNLDKKPNLPTPEEFKNQKVNYSDTN